MRKLILLVIVILLSLAGGRYVMAQESETPAPAVAIKYIYISCNNLEAMYDFYTGLLGMQAAAYSNEGGQGYLCYDCNGVEVMFFPAGNELPVLDDWTDQPGWPGGVLEGISWSVEVPLERYADTVAALKNGGVNTYAAWPMWCVDSYWGFPVRDPMGNTVEVYAMPKERPQNTEWPAE